VGLIEFKQCLFNDYDWTWPNYAYNCMHFNLMHMHGKMLFQITIFMWVTQALWRHYPINLKQHGLTVMLRNAILQSLPGSSNRLWVCFLRSLSDHFGFALVPP
jgi:hypothetical protein